MANQNDELYLKWDEWLNTLTNEIDNLHAQREMFNDVQEIIRNNSLIKPNHFLHNMAMWYSSFMAVTIRKLADTHSNAISYRRLLECIKSNPRFINRTHFINSFVDGNYTTHIANVDFDYYAGAGNEYLDIGTIDKEIKELVQKTETLKDYVDIRVAHNDKKELKTFPTFNDLNDAIDYLVGLHIKYYAIFRCVEPTFPAVDFSNWKEIFYFPWINRQL